MVFYEILSFLHDLPEGKWPFYNAILRFWSLRVT